MLPRMEETMKSLSRSAGATLIGVSFILLCLSQPRVNHAAGKRPAPRESPSKSTQVRRNTDFLSGEWRVKCDVRTYQNGEPNRTNRDMGGSLVVVESDLDGSYFIYRFPAGFGEGLPRLRKVASNRYEGDDTFRGITTVARQSVTVQNETITIKHTVFDAPGNKPQSDTTCTGSRLQGDGRFLSASRIPDICPIDTRSSKMPPRSLAGRYRIVKPFSDGMAAVAGTPRGARTARWGFIDETGRLVIPMRYDEVTSFHDGLAAVGKYYGRGRNLKWGVVEKLGPQVTPQLKYDAVRILGEGFAAVGYGVPGRSGLKWNLINRENTTIFHGFDDIGCFVGGRARATHTEGTSVRRGYVDKVGDFFAENR